MTSVCVTVFLGFFSRATLRPEDSEGDTPFLYQPAHIAHLEDRFKTHG